MKSLITFIFTLFFSFALLTVNDAMSDEGKPSFAHSACSTSESWSFSESLNPLLQSTQQEWKFSFQAFLKGKLPAVRGFAEALALRRTVTAPEPAAFAEYWISRSLYQAKLTHIAAQGFRAIIAREPTPGTLGIQTAALECLLRIQEQFPTLELPEDLTVRTARAASTLNPDVSHQAILIVLQQQLAQNRPVEQLDHTLSLFKSADNDAYFHLAQSLVAAKQMKHREVVQALEAFRALNPSGSLTRYRDDAELLLAHAYFKLGDYTHSVNAFKRVAKSSNRLAQSLSELTWAFLLSERYGEAIGTAMNLQAGGLRHTFAPEAPMVLAMALNELCQYPESLRAIRVFLKNYHEPYEWLKKWKASPDQALYSTALHFIQKQEVNVPVRVASEWVRSPLFISHQEEINLLFDEKDAANQIGKIGSQEQAKLAQEIKEKARDLRAKIQEAKTSLKPGADLPPKLVKELALLRTQVSHYRRLRAAAPSWHQILANHVRRASGIEQKLVAEINTDLKTKNLLMFAQLEEILENNQLIEVEIYNGASSDLIWQNAHPDYKQVMKKVRDDRSVASADKVWDWGTEKLDDAEAGEIWEDELGSFNAKTFDNCSNKERYLALKRTNF